MSENLSLQTYKVSDDEEVTIFHDPANRTFWASQKSMAIMFDVTPANILMHIKNIENEMGEEATIQDCLVVQIEGGREVRRKIRHYNHEMILMVGFRCNSLRAKRYQQWALDVLYREIMHEARHAEREAYRDLLHTMALATDYHPSKPSSQFAFARMQDMMHYAAAGLSATGIIINRADRRKKHMGLTNFPGKRVVKKDVVVAKNYLNEQELEHQRKIAAGFMFAIDIAVNGPEQWKYTQQDLLNELKDFLIKYHQRILEDHMRFPSRQQANSHAYQEYEAYKTIMAERLSLLASGQDLPEEIE